MSAPPRRPRSLLVLLLFFCWLDARALGWIVFPRASASWHFYEALGAAWLHYVLQAVTVALAATATGYLWRPSDGWLQSSLLAIGVLSATTLAGTWMTVRHLDLARSSYAASREARGLPVPPERLAELFTPGALWGAAAAMLVAMALLAALAWRRRDWAAPDDAEA